MLVFKVLFSLVVGLEFIFVPLFLKAMWPKKNKKSLVLKMVCAALFVAAGILAIEISGNTSVFAKLMLSGLIFGAVGDYFLHASSRIGFFIFGLMSFLAGHIFYIAAFGRAASEYFPEAGFFNFIDIGIIALIYACFITYSVYKKIDLGKALVPVMLYAAVLITMFVKGSSLGIRLPGSDASHAILGCLFLTGGALQFFISDSLWANINFNGHKKNRSMKNANIITYFGAQIFFACTVFFIK